jgi:uncharacterized membrane protein
MSEFFFVIKTLIFSIALILLLQIKIGKSTLEERSLSWMRQSIAIEALRGVADSAVTVAGEAFDWAKTSIDSHATGNESKRDRHSKRQKEKDDAVELD